MPGLVKMENRGANGTTPPPITGKRTAQEAFGQKDAKSDGLRKNQSNAMPNGDVSSPQQNGPVANGAPAVQSQQPSVPDSPSELPHITQGYRSFGQLICRTSQLALEEFGRTVNKINTQRGPGPRPPPALPNGINSHGLVNGAPSGSSEARKELLDYYNTTRERFIKLTVLADWANKVDDVGKMIDLNAANEAKFRAYDDAKFRIADLHRRMHFFKQKQPDLKTALEVLGTGKASWMPDLGCLPKPPLTPEKTLRALREMNIALQVRLNVHEDLPLYLRNHRIHDGRVTFSFPGEFELDVTIVNEDSKSPYYFIDLRFLFSPVPVLSGGVTRSTLTQQKLDPILAAHGITGCCDFLHEFVLTHKIAVLKKQATQMRDGNWTGTLYLTQIHRSLMVQYWIDPNNPSRPKSWIEIGINSGKPKNGKAKHRLDGREWNSFIQVKWMMAGRKSTPQYFSFDFNKLDMQALLNKIIAAHTNHILTSIRDKLQEAAAGSRSLQMKLHSSETDPRECYLEVRVGRDAQWTKIEIHPVLGCFLITPRSRLALLMTTRLNTQWKDPSVDAHLAIQSYLAVSIRDSIVSEAVRRGWKLPRHAKFDPAQLEKAFNSKFLQVVRFDMPGWSSCNYLLSVTINLDGCTWWLIEVEHRVTGGKILSQRKIGHYGRKDGSVVDQSFLEGMEFNAVQELAFWTASTQLDKAGVRNIIQLEPATQRWPNTQLMQGRLQVNYNDLMKRTSTGATTVSPDIFIALRTFIAPSGECHLVARGDFRPEKGKCGTFEIFSDDKVYFVDDNKRSSLDEFSSDNTKNPSDKSQTQPTQTVTGEDSVGRAKPTEECPEFGFYLSVPIGTSCVDQLVSLLNSSIRTRNFLSALAAAKFTPTEASLSKLAFSYSSNPTLTAVITFPGQGTSPTPISLTGTPLTQSPQTPPTHCWAYVSVPKTLTAACSASSPSTSTSRAPTSPAPSAKRYS